MKIHFTRHAKNRMRWRKITVAEVESVINNFDRREYLNQNKFHLYKSINNRHLRVTVAYEQDNIIILSVVDKHD